MVYFSRLTDIVTCNLNEMLAREPDHARALTAIIVEMEEGLAGAKRSVATAAASEERLRKEIAEQRDQIERWTGKARRELLEGREDQARAALERKQEALDVIAGLEQQHHAAVATRDHLTTTLRALEARLAEARRRLHDCATARDAGGPSAKPAPTRSAARDALGLSRSDRVDAELDALKRELNK